MFKDNKLRLLMTLAGFERLGIDDEPDTTWIIPSALSASELHETHDAIQKHRNDPVMHYGDEDPMSAEEMLRRKPSSRRAAYDDDSEGDGVVSDGEEDFIFPGGGGPTNTNRKSAALEELKKIRRKRRISCAEDGLDDETREARRKARIEADLEKRRKIKSAQFVVESDEEDEEADRMFFEKEEERRKTHAAKVLEALRAGKVDGNKGGSDRKSKKRKSHAVPVGDTKKSKISAFYSDTEDDDPMDESSSLPPSRAVSVSSEDDSQDTPLSSPHVTSSQEKVLKNTTGNSIPLHDTTGTKDATNYDVTWDESNDENVFPAGNPGPAKRDLVHKGAVASNTDDEDDENLIATAPRSRQLRAVLVDSDDE